MRIAILVEGQTEKVFLPFVRQFLNNRHQGPLPKLRSIKYDGRIPKEEKLKRCVENLLRDGDDYVIALTDVYTGTDDFKDAADAKQKMKDWAGNNSKFSHMPPNMISKLGYFPTGTISRGLPSTIRMHLRVSPNR